MQSALDDAAANEPNAVQGAQVDTSRPDGAAPNTHPRVSIYLDRITPNPTWQNNDLPMRDSEGYTVQIPKAAFDLHYLFTFYGNETTLEPQRMLGVVARTLHARPVLTQGMIESTIRDLTFSFVANADLANEVEQVKFTPVSLSLEELSKMWSVFFQTPHALTVAYDASVIFVDATVMPRQALPVRDREVRAVSFRQPAIDRIFSQAGDTQPILQDGTIVISGKQLHGEVTLVRIFGTEVTPLEVLDTRITLQLSSPPLPVDSIRAGINAVQIVQRVKMSDKPGQLRGGFESNVAAFALQPILNKIQATNVPATPNTPASTKIEALVTPRVRKSQRVTLLLNENSQLDPASYILTVPPPAADTDTITLNVVGVKLTQYIVRVAVDGAQSPLTMDQNLAYSGPTVTIA